MQVVAKLARNHFIKKGSEVGYSMEISYYFYHKEIHSAELLTTDGGTATIEL